MLKSQIALIAILITCVAFTSCERIQQVIIPAPPPDTDTMPDPVMDEN